jgi:hypothetical protein
LLIGVILGGGAGFAYIYTVLTPQAEALQATVEGLQADLSALDTEFDTLTGEHEELQEQLQTLQGEHETLVGEYEMLQGQYQQLTSEYESLLSDYEAAFGGLDISPESIPVMEREYTWTWEGAERTVSIVVPEALYDYYSVKARYLSADYSGYVLHPLDDNYVAVLAREFEVYRIDEGLTEQELMGLTISFVQSFEYVTDSPSGGIGDYPNYPVETLIGAKGDCEDTSILLASLLESMGYQVSLLLLPNHMAVGLAANATGVSWTMGNVTYYYLETTTSGWNVGQIPPEFSHDAAEVFPVGTAPYVYPSWSATILNEKVTARVTTTNEGRLTAEGYRVRVTLEDQDGQVVAEAQSPLFSLAFEESRSDTLKLTGPRFETLRLVISIVTPGGESIGEQYSTYFTTH